MLDVNKAWHKLQISAGLFLSQGRHFPNCEKGICGNFHFNFNSMLGLVINGNPFKSGENQTDDFEQISCDQECLILKMQSFINNMMSRL